MLLNRRPSRFLRQNAAGGGGQNNEQGGGGDGGQGGGQGGQGGGRSRRDDSPYRDDDEGGTALPGRAEMQFQALRTRHANNDQQVARFLYDDNHTLRQKLRRATDELEGFRTRNPQGSVVLTGEALAEYNALKALGKSADLKAALDDATKTKADLAAAKTKEARKNAAAALKWAPAVLDDRLTIAALDVEVREETDAQNQKVQVPYVRKAGDANATWERLSVIAERDWKEHLPALRAVAQGGAGAGDGAGAGAGESAPVYVPFPDNGATGGTTSTGLVDQFIQNTQKSGQKKTNPLRTQGAPAGQS